MSEDNIQTSLEELRTLIMDASKNIAQDSDAMRLNMERVADALLPIIKQSGIRFGGSQTWNSEGHKQLTCRIGIRNDNRWQIGVEMSTGVPKELSEDGHGWKDIFCEEAYDTITTVAHMCSFSVINRSDLAQALNHLPYFLEEYLDELDTRSVEYTDLRKKAEAIREIVEG